MHCFGKNLCKVGGGLGCGGGGGGGTAILLNHTTTNNNNDYLTRRPSWTYIQSSLGSSNIQLYIHTKFKSIVLNKQVTMNIAEHNWKHYTRYVGCTQL